MKRIPTTATDTDGRRTIRLYSYVAVLTEKGGSHVKAVRYDRFQSKTDVMREIFSDYPDWNLKELRRLYDEDFDGGR